MTMITAPAPSANFAPGCSAEGPPASRSPRLAIAAQVRRIEADEALDAYAGPTAGPDFMPTAADEAEWVALLLAEEDRAYDAWIDQRARDRWEAAFAGEGPRETDGYPAGYCS